MTSDGRVDEFDLGMLNFHKTDNANCNLFKKRKSNRGYMEEMGEIQILVTDH